uniref:Uncharacterized protein n=1 Tax=Lygus hesperus TaxID=30085 RepID=A0A0K8SU96_LYGHE
MNERVGPLESYGGRTVSMKVDHAPISPDSRETTEFCPHFLSADIRSISFLVHVYQRVVCRVTASKKYRKYDQTAEDILHTLVIDSFDEALNKEFEVFLTDK